MSDIQNIQKVSVHKIKVSEKALPTWWLVFRRELTDLWIGGKAFNLVLIYSLLLGGMVYIYSFNTELSLIPPKEAVYEMLKNAMAVAMFVGLIIGADAFSGERDRATLESLLLTPANRRQIIMGKFLAAFSIWPAAYVIAIPYLYVLAQGDAVLSPALFWGAVTGTVLVVGYTAVGMLVSFWSSTNKVSYFIALGIYAALLIPAELPGKSAGAAGQFLQWINPMAAVNHFLSKHLVNYRTVAEFWTWLLSPVVLALASMTVLLLAGSGLRLEAGRGSKIWAKLGRAFGLSVVAGLMAVSLLLASPAVAFQEEPALTIAIDTEWKHVKTGDSVEFSTTVTNTSSEASPPLIVAMNVINLDATGDVVDPEDWSPQRTQYMASLGPGDSARQNWIINTILEGDYMVYMVLIPGPGSAEATTHPVTSSGIHLTVDPFTRLNPGGVLPFAIGGPIVLLAITYLVYRRRRQQIDMGGSA
ncbi:MAG TPA: ABC transporter permease subunit [Anaerolineales bacterium]|nr:ABC transporter permease subunit [Anaerolineales bacterium]